MKPIHVSQKDLASWLGLGARHIRSLTTSGVLEQSPKGYDLRAAIHSYLTFLRSKTGTVSDERSRLLKAQADMAELKVRQRKGELVMKSLVRQKTFDLTRQARETLHNLPSRLSGILAAESDQQRIFAFLTDEIRLVLEDLSHDQSPTPPTE